MNKKMAVLRRMAGDLLFFGRVVVREMFTVRSADFHTELADALIDTKIRKLAVQAPRAHAKSSIAACLLPLWHLIFHRGPVYIILVSKTEGHAIMLLQTIKDVLEYSRHFRALFGYWGKYTSRAWQEAVVKLTDPRDPRRSCIIQCRGASQQVRGLKHIHQRPTLVIYDDPEDEKNTLTEVARRNNLEGLLKAIVPALDPSCGRVILIGTPIHAQGMVSVVAEMPGWVSLHWHALIKRGHEHGRFLVTREDISEYTALWPEVWPVDRLLEEYESYEGARATSGFYSEYQCEIVGDSDQLFSRSDFRYWRGSYHRDINGEAYLSVEAESPSAEQAMQHYEEPKLIPVNIFMGIDPASSIKKTADYTAVVVIAATKDLKIYLLEIARGHLLPNQISDLIVSLYEKYKPKDTQIETVLFQEALQTYIIERVGVFIPGIGKKNSPRSSKSDRLAGLQPDFTTHKVFIRKGERNMSIFEDELAFFPRGRNDDILDGFFYARKGVFRPYHDVHLEGTPLSRKRLAREESWMTI